MKATILAAAAAMVAGQVSAAGSHGHRQAHRALFEKKEVDNGDGVCLPTCTTIYSTITGQPTLVPPAPVTTSTSAPPPPVTTSSGPILVPTPIAQTCPTPGTYTFPATTVVVTKTTTVCGASSTTLPSGTHTIGGVTTVVETATTVVCPYATTETQPNGVVTSVIKTTTYVCPSAGTYTIAPITTTVPSVTTVIVPVVTTYCPGTYTAPAVVTTVTETDIVVYCPFTSSEAPAPTSAPVAATSAAPAPAQSSASSSPSTSLGSSSGKLWAMTYTPYDASGHCKTASAVLSDVVEIAKAGFTTMRVYSTDCDTLTNVGAAARQYGLRLIVGIFIGEVGCDNASPDVADQISALKAWKQWDLVDLCVVANEALANGFCTVSQLTDLITHVKSELVSVGYTGAFTTTDVVASWLNLEVQAICEVIDVVGTNAHAYFNAQTLPEAAGVFVAGQLALVEKVCNKPGYVLETGWPSEGDCNGLACPSADNQRIAIEAIREEIGNKVTFFSLHDDTWKEAGKCNCEKHWGCSSVFGINL